MARIGKENAGRRADQLPQRDKNPRQPPTWPSGGAICSANSSRSPSSSIPGSSGARIRGITAGIGDGAAFGISWRARNKGAAAGADSAGGEDGAGAVGEAGSAAGSTTAAGGGALSCAARGTGSTGFAAGSPGASGGGST